MERAGEAMSVLTIVIPGQPVAWGRVKTGKYLQRYVPRKTQRAEDTVSSFCFHAMNEQGFKIIEGEAIRLECRFYMQIPKSESKGKRDAMQRGQLRPIKRPDFDNLYKSVLDGIQGVAFRDDSQIVETGNSGKWYDDGKGPRTEIRLGVVVYAGDAPEGTCVKVETA